MTRDHDLHPKTRRLVRAVGGTVIAAGLLAAGLAVDHGPADAARRTKSAVIAETANEAVAALDQWTHTQNPVDYILFIQHRDQAAEMTERDVELPQGALSSAWSSVSITKQHTILSAVSQLGVPYRSLASDPGVGFDCSGLTSWAFGEAGVDIPRVSRDQINDAERVEQDSAEAGDLVYYPGHVSIYLGAETMVHAPNSGSHVEIGPLPDRSLRFGDAEAVHRAEAAAHLLLVDRALAVSE
jgi:cell wall-associated NlpC family hydrolase